MHLYIPRRHRRKLLFPPGLLALAGLLWLGSVALNMWQDKLKLRSVLQLTMPVLHTTPETDEYALSPDKFTAFNTWHDTYFSGLQSGDSLRAIGIIRKAAQMHADPLRDQRLRVRIGPNATYTELVFLLNTMLKCGIQRYALDIKHRPTTFYAFTTNPYPRKKEPVSAALICGGTGGCIVMSRVQPTTFSYWSASYLDRFVHWLATLFNPDLLNTTLYTSARGTGGAYDITLELERQYWSSIPGDAAERTKFLLLQSEWRIPLVLFGFMAILSCWQLKRQLQYH
jgi:hypothetical protein